MALADPAADLHAASAGNFREIERALVVEHAQMHRIFAFRRERLEVRVGALEHVGLALRVEAELEQLGAELVAVPRGEAQVAALDERGREPVRGRAGEAEPRGELVERDGPIDHRLDHVEPAQQRLAAALAAGPRGLRKIDA